MTIYEAFLKGKAARKAGNPQRAILYVIAEFLGSRLPSWKAVRTNVLALGGFGFIDFAAYQWNHILGYAALGASLLIIEALGGDKK